MATCDALLSFVFRLILVWKRLLGVRSMRLHPWERQKHMGPLRTEKGRFSTFGHTNDSCYNTYDTFIMISFRQTRNNTSQELMLSVELWQVGTSNLSVSNLESIIILSRRWQRKVLLLTKRPLYEYYLEFIFSFIRKTEIKIYE